MPFSTLVQHDSEVRKEALLADEGFLGRGLACRSLQLKRWGTGYAVSNCAHWQGVGKRIRKKDNQNNVPRITASSLLVLLLLWPPALKDYWAPQPSRVSLDDCWKVCDGNSLLCCCGLSEIIDSHMRSCFLKTWGVAGQTRIPYDY